jgi:ribonucleoside-diphosphate reductase beta chain
METQERLEATRLESVDTKGLSAHTPDEVLDEILTRAETRYSFADFYHRWEHQQWQATEIDLTQDARDWAEIPAVVRDQLQGTMAGFYQGEESVTRNLAPLLLAAVTVPQEVFLSTQIIDEARHLVFFERYFKEVIGMHGDAQAHLELFRPDYSQWYANLFFSEDLGLDGRADRLRQNPDDRGLYAETVTLYHLVLESGLALLGQRFLLDLCRGLGKLPGFYEGFMAVTRDESRHVGGGVRILRELRENDPAIGDRILGVMYDSLPHVVRLIHPPDEDYDMELINYIPEDYLQAPQESHRYSLNHVLKRLSAVGLPSDEVNKLGEFAWSEFEGAIAEWEERTAAALARHSACERDCVHPTNSSANRSHRALAQVDSSGVDTYGHRLQVPHPPKQPVTHPPSDTPAMH